MFDLAIFAALRWEREAVLAGLVDVAAEGGHRWRGRLQDGATCVVAQTGIGLERAGRAAAGVPLARAMIVCGCAGALAADLGAGDVVVADDVLALDAQGRVIERLPTAGPALTAAAPTGRAVRAGNVATSPVMLADPRAKRDAARSGALVVDMETATLAAAARSRGVPFAAVRVVLDRVGDDLGFAAEFVDAASGEVRVARAIGQLAVCPWRWPAAVRLARATAIAGRRLREVGPPLLASMAGLARGRPHNAIAG